MRIYIKIKHGDCFLHKDEFGNCVTYKAINRKYATGVSYRGFYKNFIRVLSTGEPKNTDFVTAMGVIKIL